MSRFAGPGLRAAAPGHAAARPSPAPLCAGPPRTANRPAARGEARGGVSASSRGSAARLPTASRGAASAESRRGARGRAAAARGAGRATTTSIASASPSASSSAPPPAAESSSPTSPTSPLLLESLNERLAVPPHVTFHRGADGCPKVVLRHACGSSAEVSLRDGRVLSWRQASGDHVLAQGRKEGAESLRGGSLGGGLAIVLPGVGLEQRSRGFAVDGSAPSVAQTAREALFEEEGACTRSDPALRWRALSSSADPQPDDRDPEIQLGLDLDGLEGYPEGVSVFYDVLLHGESLRIDLRVVNASEETVRIPVGLLGYFEVVSLTAAGIGGVGGATAAVARFGADALEGPKAAPPLWNPVPAAEEGTKKGRGKDAAADADPAALSSLPLLATFASTRDYAELRVGTGAAVALNSEGFPDALAWVEHQEDDDQPAVGLGPVSLEPVEIEAGEFWRGQLALSVVDL